MKQEKDLSMKMQPSGISNSDLPYYVATKIFRQLINSQQIVLKLDQDRIYVIDGREGLGKSKLARQLAYVVDPTICLDRIVFSSKDFEAAIRKADKHQAIIFDECFRGLSGRSSLSKENKRLVQLMMECRQKNLFVFLVLPSYFLLEKYAAIFRSTALFHVMASNKDPKRRYYKPYNYKQKKFLYILGKQMMDYSKPRVPYTYRFYNKEIPTVDYDAYAKKKLAAFQDLAGEELTLGKLEERFMLQRNVLIIHDNKVDKKPQREIAKIMKDGGAPMTMSTIAAICANAPKIP